MALTADLEIVENIAKITLSGELDRNTATIFQQKIEEAAKYDVNKLVLLMEELEYMASAGLRVLIFAKQKMGTGVDIYVVKPQEMVKDTIEKTGFHHSVIMQDEYEV